ncbi:unnamed protein product [Candidula unifasciata]|uniref:Uncharacterized protein n=1 Tax=Candidula unifasciata TaxID=100452 RepID=A0A8S3YX17_9EUPU|nr:unnamed protein product [Candidula unifasciata]
MIHVTAEIGKTGKKEREKRHFPDVHNKPGKTNPSEEQGRRHIYMPDGREEPWKPHYENINVKYTESGPDWSSKLKYIPAPSNPDYPAAEIWPDNWKALRPYPFSNRQSQKEWILAPNLTKLGLRCFFDGVHMASLTSDKEVMYGCARHEDNIDKRNSLAEASPGYKSYQVPEYSSSFYKTSSEDIMPRFRMSSLPYITRPYKKADTFIPLVPLPHIKRKTFRHKMEKSQKQEEVEEVRILDLWQPAKPISERLLQFELTTDGKKQ